MKLITPDSDILWSVSLPINDIKNQVKAFLPSMRKILDTHRGYGLSAPQVGVPYRFFITRIEGAKVIINPILLGFTNDLVSHQEGCLSFPGRFVSVARSKYINFEWTDLKYHVHKKCFSDMEARILLHELDHLNGICIFPNETAPKV